MSIRVWRLICLFGAKKGGCMVYIDDSDLEFLKEVRSKDLDALIYCLTHDIDGELRFSEELTVADEYKNITS